MEELIHQADCTGETEYQTSGIIQIAYCLECGSYKTEAIECEHDWVPISFVISNGTKQIKKYCKKCQVITSKPEKKSNYEGVKLLVKSLEDYHNHYALEWDKSKDSLEKLIEDLNVAKITFNKTAYYEYLKSDHWDEKKHEIMERDKHICQICGKPAFDVHHLTYRHRDKEFNFELVALCRQCHYNEYHPEKNTNPI